MCNRHLMLDEIFLPLITYTLLSLQLLLLNCIHCYCYYYYTFIVITMNMVYVNGNVMFIKIVIITLPPYKQKVLNIVI